MTSEEKNALWNTLSDDAKNVLEWIQDERTGKYNELNLSIGKEFFVDGMDKGIPMTSELLKEIITFAMKSGDLTCDVKTYQVFIKENDSHEEEINTDDLEK